MNQIQVSNIQNQDLSEIHNAIINKFISKNVNFRRQMIEIMKNDRLQNPLASEQTISSQSYVILILLINTKNLDQIRKYIHIRENQLHCFEAFYNSQFNSLQEFKQQVILFFSNSVLQTTEMIYKIFQQVIKFMNVYVCMNIFQNKMIQEFNYLDQSQMFVLNVLLKYQNIKYDIQDKLKFNERTYRKNFINQLKQVLLKNVVKDKNNVIHFLFGLVNHNLKHFLLFFYQNYQSRCRLNHDMILKLFQHKSYAFVAYYAQNNQQFIKMLQQDRQFMKKFIQEEYGLLGFNYKLLIFYKIQLKKNSVFEEYHQNLIIQEYGEFIKSDVNIRLTFVSPLYLVCYIMRFLDQIKQNGTRMIHQFNNLIQNYSQTAYDLLEFYDDDKILEKVLFMNIQPFNETLIHIFIENDKLFQNLLESSQIKRIIQRKWYGNNYDSNNIFVYSFFYQVIQNKIHVLQSQIDTSKLQSFIQKTRTKNYVESQQNDQDNQSGFNASENDSENIKIQTIFSQNLGDKNLITVQNKDSEQKIGEIRKRLTFFEQSIQKHSLLQQMRHLRSQVLISQNEDQLTLQNKQQKVIDDLDQQNLNSSIFNFINRASIMKDKIFWFNKNIILRNIGMRNKIEIFLQIVAIIFMLISFENYSINYRKNKQTLKLSRFNYYFLNLPVPQESVKVQFADYHLQNSEVLRNLKSNQTEETVEYRTLSLCYVRILDYSNKYFVKNSKDIDHVRKTNIESLNSELPSCYVDTKYVIFKIQKLSEKSLEFLIVIWTTCLKSIIITIQNYLVSGSLFIQTKTLFDIALLSIVFLQSTFFSFQNQEYDSYNSIINFTDYFELSIIMLIMLMFLRLLYNSLHFISIGLNLISIEIIIVKMLAFLIFFLFMIVFLGCLFYYLFYQYRLLGIMQNNIINQIAFFFYLPIANFVFNFQGYLLDSNNRNYYYFYLLLSIYAFVMVVIILNLIIAVLTEQYMYIYAQSEIKYNRILYFQYIENKQPRETTCITILNSFFSPLILVLWVTSKLVRFKYINHLVNQCYYHIIVIFPLFLLYLVGTLIMLPFVYLIVLFKIIGKNYYNIYNNKLKKRVTFRIQIIHFLTFLFLGIFYLVLIILIDFKLIYNSCFNKVRKIDEDVIQYSEYAILEKIMNGMKSKKINQIKISKLTKVFNTLKMKQHEKILNIFKRLSVNDIFYCERVYYLLKQIKLTDARIKDNKIDLFDIFCYSSEKLE